MNPNNNDNDPTTITKRSSARIIPTQLPDTWNLLRIYQRRGRGRNRDGDQSGNNNNQGNLPDIVLVQGSVVDFGSGVNNTTPKKKKAAIVNAANEICLGGGGVDGAITDAGGPNLARDRLNLPIIGSGRDSSSGGGSGDDAKKDENKDKKDKNDNKKRSRCSDDNEEHPSDEENGSSMSVGSSSGSNQFGGIRCPTGTAVMTGPGDYGELHVPYVIHAVGPNYWDYNMSYEMVQQGHQLLRGAYMQSLDLASTEIHEIAFCLLSAGIFRGRLKLMTVLRVGLESIFDWRQNNSDKTTTSSTLERIYICGFNHRECDILVAVGDGLAARRGSTVSIVMPPADGDDYEKEEEEVAVAMETVSTTTPETPRDHSNNKSLDTDDGSKPFDEVEDQKKEAGVWTAVVNAVAEQQKVDDENDTNIMKEYEKQKNDTTKKSASAVDTSMSSIETPPPPPPPLPPVVLKTTTADDQKEAVEMVQGGDDDDTIMADKQKNDPTKISPAVDTSMSSIETPPPPPPVLLEATTTDDQKKAVVAAQKDDDDTNMAEEGEKKDTKPPAVDTSLSSIDGPSPRPVLETTTTDDQKKKTSSSSSPVVGIEAASGDHEMAED